MRRLTQPRMTSATVPQDRTLGVYMQTSDDGIEIFLHGYVGDDYSGTNSQSVAQLLSQNRGKPVTLRVNSPGGLAFDGVAIYNAIASHDGPTTGIIEGLAGSAASLAVIAADTVKAYPSGQFHPHYAIGLAFGHQAEIRDTLRQLEVLDSEIEQLYAERSGQSLEKVKQDLLGPEGDGTLFTARDAVSAGYVHEVIELPKRKAAAAKIDMRAMQADLRLRHLQLFVDEQRQSR